MLAVADIPFIIWSLGIYLTDKKWLIFVLSILLNWTFIGWIILLVVSINMNKEAERIRQQQMMMQMAGQQGSSGTFNPFQ